MRFILSLLMVVNLLSITIANANHYALSYDNVPITAKTWEEIDIKWNHGNAQLLRPIRYAHKHGLVVRGHVQMDLAEFGVPDAAIMVTAVKPLTVSEVNKVKHLPNNENPIIGIYIHQTNDVRTYHFKDTQGKTLMIHSTPTHPFYVKNLHTYVPISQVIDTMQFAGKNNETIYLACPKGQHQHCGIPYHKGKITTVYNIEVYQKHFYRVSKDSIKVHNECYDARLVRSQPTVGSGKSGVVRLDPYDPNYVIKDFGEFAFEPYIDNEVSIFNRYYENTDYSASKISLSDGTKAMRMSKLPGVPLEKLPPNEITEGLTIAFQKMKDRLVESSINHTDIKRENILYDKATNTAYAIDFGGRVELYDQLSDLHTMGMTKKLNDLYNSLLKYKTTRYWVSYGTIDGNGPIK